MREEQSVSHYRKMTETAPARLVVQLGIPTMISMLVTNIYNLVDTMFVGRLGTSASGAVGVVFGFMGVLQAFGFMYGQGSGSTISRKLGAKDPESAGIYASTGLILSFGTGVVITLLGFLFLDPMLRVFGSTETILPYARTYITYILAAAPFMMSCFTMNNILRFEGKAYLAMIGLLAGAILNMVGDPIFMFGLNMGIAGAGLSTALSQFISFLILGYMFVSGRTQSRLSPHNFTRDFRDVGEIVGVGMPSMLRQGLGSVSVMVLNHAAAVYGDPAVAAMSIVGRITMFMASALIGIGQGYQPVCGFNYGAKRYDRVKAAFRATLLIGTGIMLVTGVAELLFAEPLVSWFRDDPEVIAIGVPALRYAGIVSVFQPVCVMSSMTLQSSGQKVGASVLAMLRSGLCFIPTVAILSRVIGLTGVQIAQPVADAMTVIISVPYILRFFKKLERG